MEPGRRAAGPKDPGKQKNAAPWAGKHSRKLTAVSRSHSRSRNHHLPDVVCSGSCSVLLLLLVLALVLAKKALPANSITITCANCTLNASNLAVNHPSSSSSSTSSFCPHNSVSHFYGISFGTTHN